MQNEQKYLPHWDYYEIVKDRNFITFRPRYLERLNLKVIECAKNVPKSLLL